MGKFFSKVYYKISGIIDNILPKYFVANPWMSSLYYFIFSNKFKREHHAVLKGKVDHLKELEKNKSNVYTLIRNTHRIEKGLLMRPRRDVFALDFITETLDAFTKVWDISKNKKNDQHKWFYDVLNEYFLVCASHPIIEKEKKRFMAKTSTLDYRVDEIDSEKSIPYTRIASHKPAITYEEFYQLTKYRRSVRWFLEKRVPRDLVDKAIMAASQSPSACNRQPFEYRIIDEPQLLNQVANLPGGVKGYVEGIPMMVVTVGNLNAYFDERDRHVIYIDASLANMSLMLAFETLGLSTCAINWPDVEIRERKMEKTLILKKHQRVIMCMAVGYPDPDGKVAFSEKRSLNHIRKYN